MNTKLIKSIMAGICISIGCIANISCDNRYVGAVLFSFGLLAVCSFGYDLFTGKVCYLDNWADLALILLGNLLGSALTAIVFYGCVSNKYQEKITTICEIKLNEPILSTFLLGVLCNIMIYFAVEGFKHKQVLLLIGGVSIFVLCGFEHCVANAFYVAYYSLLIHVSPVKAVMFFICNIFGNVFGGRMMKNIGKVVIN